MTFPLFSKIVVKGKGIDPLYDFLTSKESNPKFSGPISWNFAKFLVNKKGEVIAAARAQGQAVRQGRRDRHRNRSRR